MLNSPVQKIKERLSIEEVASSYISLEKAGKNFKAKCPFHNEKTPSFFISPERGSYYCFGCGAKGDIFSFVEEFEGLDFKGALKLLATKAGVPLENYNPKEESEKEKLYRAMEEATQFFEKNLKENKEIQDYLKTRGLNEETIKIFRLGYAPNEWTSLYAHLKSLFSDSEMAQAGLIKKGEKPGQGYYDRFRGRIIFPISDSSGRVIAFSGRIFIDDEKSAKYLNSPDTPIFNKSLVLFGLDKAKESIRKNNFSILVEGQMDLVLSHQVGFKNTVATSGTALADTTFSKENVVSNLGLLRRLSRNIVLAFDSDKAGFNASNRAGKIALSLGMDVKVAAIPEEMDPADLISKEGVDSWRKAIRESGHIIEFLLNKVLKSAKDERSIGKEIKEKILPYVDALDSSIEKAHFLKKISDVSGVPQSALEQDLNKVEQEAKYEKIETVENTQTEIQRKEYILRRLLGIILWQKTLSEQIPNLKEMSDETSSILGISIDQSLDKVKNETEDLIFEAEIFYAGGTTLEKDIKELLENLKEESLREELGKKMRELYKAERDKDVGLSAQILKECQAINKQIQDIKNGHLKE